jgi:iron complex transport system permease protein
MKRYMILAAFFVLTAFLTFIVGDTPWQAVWKGALERLTNQSSHWNPLLDERIPRLIVLICTGASLAVSGAVMQALFQNPLASPNVLGVACGGSLLVVVVFMFGWNLEYPYAVPIAAFGGCLATLLLVYAVSRKKGGIELSHLILTGLAVSTLLFAIQGAIMYALRDRWGLIQALTEWMAGSTLDRSWNHVHMQLPLTIVGLLGCLRYMQEINILALGEEEAASLGVEVSKVRWRLFLFVSLLTGGAIAAVGIIAFFGLILPHLIRRVSGPDNRQLIPLCIVAGGIALAALDLFLRLVDIHTFSIGNVSAILGGVFFLLLLLRSRNPDFVC